jgi:hypothetical protein
MKAGTCVVATLLLASCGVTRVTFRGASSDTTYHVAGDADQHAANLVVEQYDSDVKRLMESDRKPPRIYVVREETIEGGVAITTESAIYLAAGAKANLPEAVVHELAHWHSFNRDKALPHAIEEGMAIYVEAALGVSAAESVAIPGRSDLEQILSMTVVETVRLSKKDPDQAAGLAEVGYSLVDRIGFETLRRMHQQGRTAPRDVLAAARLP